MGSMHRISSAALGAALVVAIGPAGGAFAAVTKTVRVANVVFQPSSVTLAQGDSIKWTWVSGDHSTTSGSCSGSSCTPDGIWDSGVKSSGSFTRVFHSQGTFHYYCTVHGSMMQGTVTVGPPPPLAAAASASNACGVFPLDVAFSGTGSGGHPPYTFSWDFGDGSAPSDVQNPLHTYVVSGDFTASLLVMDADATTAQATVAITASDVPLARITRVTKLVDPFRLAITGTGFATGIDQPTCTIKIDGVPVPSSKCVSATKVVARKGADLKAMLPLNQPVVMTVVDNHSGLESCPFSYTRKSASTYNSTPNGDPYP